MIKVTIKEKIKEKNKTVKLTIGLPWVSVAIGVISGWIVMGTTEGLIVGGALGVVVAFACYLGLIPFVGWWVYGSVVNVLFQAIGHEMPILYWWGMLFAAIFCIITSFVAVIIILAGLAEFLTYR